MGITSISAGTGPAAAILGGVALVSFGYGAGWLLVIGGVGLSVLWAMRFA